jgi:hypothetical protein
VNQAQVGQALEIVNQLNGSDYQITAAFPKDPAGDWIVDASADIGTWFYQAGVDTGLWFEQAAKDVVSEVSNFVTGGPASAGSRSISFNNQAGYVAYMTVMYMVDETINGVTVPMPKVMTTADLTAGFTRSIEIPYALTQGSSIQVFITAYGTFENNVYSTTVSPSFTGDVCYKAWGTIFDTEGGSCN